MSAISGIVRFDDAPVDRESIARVEKTLAVYGADQCNTLYLKRSAFAWNGFVVTPEDRLDRQPVVDNESGLTTLFDGRVDNRGEMAAKVGIKRAELAELSDAFLVARLVKKIGKRAPDLLRGDFALACWSSSQRELWLARDPAGLRPLFWFSGQGFAAFSSMPKGLFCFPGIAKRLDKQYVEDYLLLLPADGDRTLFDRVHRVIPGTIVTIDPTGSRCERHHDFAHVKDVRFSSDEEYIEAFREHLDTAVRRRLRSEGPIASYLSSGLDSTTVSACAARLLADNEQTLSSYTSVPAEGFELNTDGAFYVDEGSGAQAVAAMYPSIDHHLLRTGHISPLRDLDEMVDLLDRPPLNLCNTVWVNEIQRQAAAQGCRVLLSGVLGNSTISHQGITHLPMMLKTFKWLSLARVFYPFLRRKDWRMLDFLARQTFGPFIPKWLWVRLESLAGRGFQSDPSAYTAVKMSRDGSKRLQQRARALGWDLSYRPWSDGRAARVAMLSRIDQGEYYMLANARGLDQRAPTLDRDLAEFCLGIPESQYFREGRSSWILKQAMQGQLPREVLAPKGKGLQAADWFRGASDDISDFRARLEELAANQNVTNALDVDSLQELVEDWPDGDWGRHAVNQPYRFKLLRGLTMGAFVHRHEPTNR